MHRATFSFRACPKCGGVLVTEGTERSCLNCGNVLYATAPLPFVREHPRVPSDAKRYRHRGRFQR